MTSPAAFNQRPLPVELLAIPNGSLLVVTLIGRFDPAK